MEVQDLQNAPYLVLTPKFSGQLRLAKSVVIRTAIILRESISSHDQPRHNPV